MHFPSEANNSFKAASKLTYTQIYAGIGSRLYPWKKYILYKKKVAF